MPVSPLTTAVLNVTHPSPNDDHWDQQATGSVNPPGATIRGKVVFSGTTTVVQERQVVSDLTGAFSLVFSLNAGTYDLFVAAPAFGLVQQIDNLTVR